MAMSSSWIILTLLVLASVGYLYLRSKNKLGVLASLRVRLSALFPQNRDLVIEKLGAKTVIEQKRSEELCRVLDAKKELAKAKAKNTKLRGEIARVTETNVDGAEPPKPKKTSFITKA